MLEDESEDDYLKFIDGGVNSAYRFMQRVFPTMKEKGGKIINFSAFGAIRGGQGLGGYAAAKSAVLGLTRVAANDWGKYGINVNCVAPWAMNDNWAGMMKSLPEGTEPWEAVNLRANALRYVGDPEEDIAPPVVFLASDDAKYITGHLMPLDGGFMDAESA